MLLGMSSCQPPKNPKSIVENDPKSIVETERGTRGANASPG